VASIPCFWKQGKRLPARGPIAQRPRCRGRASHDGIFCSAIRHSKRVPAGQDQQNGFGVYRVTDICVQGDHTWIGMPQRLQGHAIGATRTNLPWVSIYSCLQRGASRGNSGQAQRIVVHHRSPVLRSLPMARPKISCGGIHNGASIPPGQHEASAMA